MILNYMRTSNLKVIKNINENKDNNLCICVVFMDIEKINLLQNEKKLPNCIYPGSQLCILINKEKGGM